MRYNNKKIFGILLIIMLLLVFSFKVSSEDIKLNNSETVSGIEKANITSDVNNNLYEIIEENNFTNTSDSKDSPALSNNISNVKNIIEENKTIENNRNDLEKTNNSFGVVSSNDTNISLEVNSTDNNYSENSSVITTNNTLENITNENISETIINYGDETSENNNYFLGRPADYMNLENITFVNNTEINYSVIKINVSISKAGKKEIEGEIPEDYDINSIKKEETIIDKNWSKQVIIKSENHLEDSLEIYTNIIEVTDNNKIVILWVNENKTIEPNRYHDTDGNGLIDRISWIVPHLSEQIYTISINFEVSNNAPEINMNIISAPNGTVSNPINFKFNISYDYLEKLNCSLFIGSYLYLLNIESNTSFNYNLPNGNYDWYLKCSDENQTKQTGIGNFKINESFTLGTDQKIYLLGEPVLMSFSSNNMINASLNFFNVNQENKTFQIYNNSGGFTLNVSKENFTKEGLYEIEARFNTLAEPFLLKTNLSFANVGINLNKENATVGEEIKIYVNISSLIEKITSIIIDFDDGTSNVSYFSISENKKSIEFTHKYLQEKNYTIKLNAIIGGRNFEIQKNKINISKNSSIDSIRPTINLISPEDDLITSNKSLNFSYYANDNIKLANCTFELYNDTGIIGILNYSKTEINPDNSTKSILLLGLSEGYYSWTVECFDNSSNSEYISRNFRIISPAEQDSIQSADKSSASANNSLKSVLNSSSTQTNNLILNLKSFIEKQNSYSMDQKEAIEDLGISSELDYYKKRLTQIDQDLSINVEYIKDTKTRDTRVQELLSELENISKKIPTDLEVLSKNDFVKNSISNDFISIIEEYLKSKNTTIGKSQLKDLAEKNYNLQGYFTVSVNVKQIKIKYNSSEKEITLIRKKINMKNDSVNILLEIIPNETSSSGNIFFINKVIPIKNSIFKLSIDDLIDNKLIYYIEENVDSKKIEKTDTLLYKEFEVKNQGITGFFVLDLNGSMKNSIYYFVMILVIVLVLFLAISKKIATSKWKKKEESIKVFSLIKETKKDLNGKNLISAKEKYCKIKELYPSLDPKCKKYIFRNIEILRNEIDRKDISSMIKEYNEAKKQGREDDAKLIYENIKTNYKRLPKKYQEKVYKRLIENP